jgi:hypothetical protein
MSESASESAAQGESDATGFGTFNTRLMRALYFTCQSSHGLMQAIEEFHRGTSPEPVRAASGCS